MSFWIITSWVLVLSLTGINIFVFLKLKQASEQMLKMAFPGAKNMNEALQKMQQMMKGFQGKGGFPGGRGGGPGGPAGGKGQLQAAMNMLQQMQNRKK